MNKIQNSDPRCTKYRVENALVDPRPSHQVQGLVCFRLVLFFSFLLLTHFILFFSLYSMFWDVDVMLLKCFAMFFLSILTQNDDFKFHVLRYFSMLFVLRGACMFFYVCGSFLFLQLLTYLFLLCFFQCFVQYFL